MEQEEKEEAWVVEFPLHFTITTNFLFLSFTVQIANNDDDNTEVSRRDLCSKVDTARRFACFFFSPSFKQSYILTHESSRFLVPLSRAD